MIPLTCLLSSSKIETVAVDGFNVILDIGPLGKARCTMNDSVDSNNVSLMMEIVIVSFGCALLSVSIESAMGIEKSNPAA